MCQGAARGVHGRRVAQQALQQRAQRRVRPRPPPGPASPAPRTSSARDLQLVRAVRLLHGVAGVEHEAVHNVAGVGGGAVEGRLELEEDAQAGTQT